MLFHCFTVLHLSLYNVLFVTFISFDNKIILVYNDEKLQFQKICQNKFIYSGIFVNKL